MTYHYVYDAFIEEKYTYAAVPLCTGVYMSYITPPSIFYPNKATTKNTCEDCIRMKEILMCMMSRNEQ